MKWHDAWSENSGIWLSIWMSFSLQGADQHIHRYSGLSVNSWLSCPCRYRDRALLYWRLIKVIPYFLCVVRAFLSMFEYKFATERSINMILGDVVIGNRLYTITQSKQNFLRKFLDRLFVHSLVSIRTTVCKVRPSNRFIVNYRREWCFRRANVQWSF